MQFQFCRALSFYKCYTVGVFDKNNGDFLLGFSSLTFFMMDANSFYQGTSRKCASSQERTKQWPQDAPQW